MGSKVHHRSVSFFSCFSLQFHGLCASDKDKSLFLLNSRELVSSSDGLIQVSFPGIISFSLFHLMRIQLKFCHRI